MPRLLEGQDRQQVTLLPECLDDLIAEDNTVRIEYTFIDELDLVALGFEGANPAKTGSPSYHPAVLLKLYGARWTTWEGASFSLPVVQLDLTPVSLRSAHKKDTTA